MAIKSSEFFSSFIKLDIMDKHLSHFDPTALCEQRLDAALGLRWQVCRARKQGQVHLRRRWARWAREVAQGRHEWEHRKLHEM